MVIDPVNGTPEKRTVTSCHLPDDIDVSGYAKFLGLGELNPGGPFTTGTYTLPLPPSQ